MPTKECKKDKCEKGKKEDGQGDGERQDQSRRSMGRGSYASAGCGTAGNGAGGHNLATDNPVALPLSAAARIWVVATHFLVRTERDKDIVLTADAIDAQLQALFRFPRLVGTALAPDPRAVNIRLAQPIEPARVG